MFRLALVISASLALATAASAQALPESLDVGDCFGEFSGCLVVRSLSDGSVGRYGADECARRTAPCSTFKIVNSLIGLDTGVLSGEDHVFTWDGTPQYLESWERDHTLASAMKYSVVWYYKVVARRVGPEAMQRYLDWVDYGNRDISGGIDCFWLSNTLQVSPDEQVRVLEDLYRNRLPFSVRSMDTVRRILVQRETEQLVYSGKTGSGFNQGEGWSHIGWWVGHVKSEQGEWVFACRIHGDATEIDGAHARVVAERALEKLAILPAEE